MPDLIVHLPNHGYADDTAIWVSWLNGLYYVDDPDTNSFKLTDGADGANVQYSENITEGYIREVDTSVGTTTISGLDHLEGETVYVTSGGEVVGSYVVSGGAITVLSDVYTYQVGKAFGWKVKTMRLEVPGSMLQTREKKISEATVRYLKSVGGKVGCIEKNVEYLQEINAEFSRTSQDTSLLTEGGLSTDGFIVLEGQKPEPFTALAVVMEVEPWEN